MAYLPQPGEQFGRYRIVGRIGRGGMGSVFEARETALDRPVALKVLSSELAEEEAFRARFLREARILASLDSPHVIQVYEQGEHEGRLYIATQLVKGSDLQQLIQSGGALAPGLALSLVVQVAAGLADAHAAGLLHRDVKPSNVLVRTDRDEPLAYLCDFGIALQPGTHHTRTSGVIGTVDYMAPERHEGQDASVASDVYSLGCVLWAALSGSAPYAGTSAVRVAMAHLSEPVPVYTGASPGARIINHVLGRSMAKDPAARYGTVAEMRRGLVAALEADRGRGAVAASPPPVAAAPLNHPTELRGPLPPGIPLPAAPRRPARRRGALAVAGAVVAIAAVGGTGYVLANRHTDGAAADARAPRAGADAATPSATPSPTRSADPAPAPATRVTSTATATVTTTVSPSAAAPTPAVTPDQQATAPATVAAPPATVTCWDGRTASEAAACGVPSGRAGMATVFPSLATDSTCQLISAKVAGKAEVYECDHGDSLVRYSRWDVGFDRYGYYDTSNGVPGSEFYVGDEFAGRQWSSYDGSAGESRRYQWSASYRLSPFSVSVEGVTEADRTDGKRLVELALPSHIGLR